MTKKIAIIPVKAKSDRVPSKNFREFFEGKSLLQIKIDQLIESKCFDEIYVSSDSLEVEKICEENNIRFLLRDRAFCNNIAPWPSVIKNVLEACPEPEDAIIAWCHVTSPLFEQYADALDAYSERKEDEDGLVAVELCAEYIVSEDKIPINYSWGVWHKYSQHLPNYYFINGALFIATKKIMLENNYVISCNPLLFVCEKISSIDIDDEADFQIAQYFYQKRHS